MNLEVTNGTLNSIIQATQFLKLTKKEAPYHMFRQKKEQAVTLLRLLQEIQKNYIRTKSGTSE